LFTAILRSYANSSRTKSRTIVDRNQNAYGTEDATNKVATETNMTKNSNRLALARKNNFGYRFTIDVYVPLPNDKSRWNAKEAKRNLKNELDDLIQEIRTEIEKRNGVLRIWQNI